MNQQNHNNNQQGQGQNLNQQQVQIKASEKKLKGDYSNLAKILHTKEEFAIDFMSVFPPTGTLNSRVLLSPGHFKRLTKAMDENLKKYEEKFGKIESSAGPEQNKIGFE
ncbi:MAG: DUF3467 domain-containing protein [Patescibacteria group bacterium]|nr:DUF3467 domain-containing protein [Patescibacteria group bacterium]